MESLSVPVDIIPKEELGGLTYHEKLQVAQQKDLLVKLDEALKLGNAFQTKVGIVFQCDQGIKRVDTTVWSKGEQFVTLKGGMWIPINHIIQISSL